MINRKICKQECKHITQIIDLRVSNERLLNAPFSVRFIIIKKELVKLNELELRQTDPSLMATSIRTRLI